MHKRLTTVIIFLAMLAVPVAVHAQNKVGVININAAIAGCGEGKKLMADLQKKYLPRQQELERLQKEIQADQDQLAKQGSAALSEDEQRQVSRDLEDKQRLLKRSTDDAQTDFNADRDDGIRRIGQKMVGVIHDYAQQNGFSLVIDGAQVPIYYAVKDIDITAEIVKHYDAANPVAEAGAPAKPAATAASTAKPK